MEYSWHQPNACIAFIMRSSLPLSAASRCLRSHLSDMPIVSAPELAARDRPEHNRLEIISHFRLGYVRIGGHEYQQHEPCIAGVLHPVFNARRGENGSVGSKL